jgi:hypothetical protein
MWRIDFFPFLFDPRPRRILFQGGAGLGEVFSF